MAAPESGDKKHISWELTPDVDDLTWDYAHVAEPTPVAYPTPEDTEDDETVKHVLIIGGGVATLAAIGFALARRHRKHKEG